MQCVFLCEERGIEYTYMEYIYLNSYTNTESTKYNVEQWCSWHMNKNSHLMDCTLWTVCMHMCVHLWTVDMPADLLSKQPHSFHTVYLWAPSLMVKEWVCKSISLRKAHGFGSVALLICFSFFSFPICNLWEFVLIQEWDDWQFSHLMLASVRVSCLLSICLSHIA